MFVQAKSYLLLLIAAFCCLSCGIPNVEMEDDEDVPSAQLRQMIDTNWISAETGPWGTLEYRRFFLPLPKPWCEAPARHEQMAWHLTNIAPAKINDLISSGPLTAVEKKLWRDTCQIEAAGDGVIIHPSKEFRWVLRPESRALLYTWLSRHLENEAQVFPFSYPASSRKNWFQSCNLRPELTEAIEHFLYPAGDAVCFADLDLLEEYIAAPEERAELLAVLHRQPCCELRIRFDRQADLGRLAVYWGEWHRTAKVHLKLKNALEASPAPEIAVSKLLPQLPRNLLDTFPPLPRDPSGPQADCYWTAFNFFNRTPDPRFSEAAYIRETLNRYHDRVEGKPAYGDILLLVNTSGQPVHAAVYLAGDFVYTKNGGHPTKPWIIMKIADMKAAYSLTGPKREVYYRWNPNKTLSREDYFTLARQPRNDK
ncbi:MAG TPA: hypothetical protein VGH19_00720 [Verrucomicrobiae bacterium]